MGIITYELDDNHDGPGEFTGGTIKVDNDRTLNVGQTLTDNAGLIPADDTDTALILALDGFRPPLKRSTDPAVEAIVAVFTPVPEWVLGTPGRGDTLVFDDDLGLYVPGTPTGPDTLIVRAQNMTRVPQTVTPPGAGLAALVDITDCQILVPADPDHEGLVRGSIYVKQGNGAGGGGGTGACQLLLVETTAGAPNAGQLVADYRPLPNVIINPLSNVGRLHVQYDIGPMNIDRTFKLSTQIIGAAGQTPSYQVQNDDRFGGLQSWISADRK